MGIRYRYGIPRMGPCHKAAISYAYAQSRSVIFVTQAPFFKRSTYLAPEGLTSALRTSAL